MAFVKIIPGDFNIEDPTWPRYDIAKIITSDDFSGSGDIAGNMTSAALGGIPAMWGGTPGGWTRSAGGAKTPQVSWLHELNMPTPADTSVSFVVTAANLISSDTERILVSLRSNAERTSRQILRIEQSGKLWHEIRNDGATSYGKSALNAFEVGDRITFEVKGSTVRTLVNGEVVLEDVAVVEGAGDLVFTTYPIADITIDDVIVTAY